MCMHCEGHIAAKLKGDGGFGYDPLFVPDGYDEPFAALDAQTRDLLLVEMQLIWEKTKKTIIFVTHNVSEAVVLGNKVVVMKHRPTSVKKEISIEYRRPRLIEDENLLKYQKEILAELRPEVTGKSSGEEK